MIELRWLVAGLVSGLLIATVIVPPTRKKMSVPSPADRSVYHTDTGCVRFTAVEVPCVEGADSLNSLAAASVAMKQWSTSLTSSIVHPLSSLSSSDSASQ
jgi:hypothetical protein